MIRCADPGGPEAKERARRGCMPDRERNRKLSRRSRKVQKGVWEVQQGTGMCKGGSGGYKGGPGRYRMYNGGQEQPGIRGQRSTTIRQGSRENHPSTNWHGGPWGLQGSGWYRIYLN